MTKAEFKKLVENGPVILDGATGTNLQKAGMPVGVCPEQWILENPDIMIKLQEDYVAAGTDILYAPTFTANRIKLEEYGLADRLEEMNRELIALSQKAAQGKALVAADMTMTGQQLYPIGELMFEDLVDVYKEQAEVAVAAGADLFVVETMMSLQECRAQSLQSGKYVIFRSWYHSHITRMEEPFMEQIRQRRQSYCRVSEQMRSGSTVQQDRRI